MFVSSQAHSMRSYQGFTCLIQISTKSTDYIIDPLKLRDSLHCLNEVFCNPKIVKVCSIQLLCHLHVINHITNF